MSLNSFRNGMGRITTTPVGKGVLFGIGAVLVFSLVYSGLGTNLSGQGGGAGSSSSGDTVIATVNGAPITQADFETTLNNAEQQMQQMGQPAPSPLQMPGYDNEVLQQLVSSQLQLAAAQKMGITATPAEIAQARQKAATQYQFAQKLSLPANATVAQIDDALSKNGDQSLEEIFPDSALSQQIILQKLQNSFVKPVTVSDAQNYYKEYHTQHILISNSKVSDVQAQNQAQQILAKAKAPGANFGALAKQYSDDPGTKDKGGDDGWIGQDNNFNNYIPEFVKAVQSLQPGEITPAPVKTPEFGYFIIKLDGVRENLPKDFAKNQAQYLDQIKQQQAQTAYQNFVMALKNDPSNKIVVKDAQLRGDQALSDAQQAQPAQQAAKYQQAVTAYQTALKTATATNAGAINAGLGEAYQGLSMLPQAIAAYKTVVADTHDQQAELTLAGLYQKTGDKSDAIAQYQAASAQDNSDPTVHQQIAAAYTALGRTDLAAKEKALAALIQKQEAAAAPPGGLPPGLSLSPSAGGGAPQVVKVTTGGKSQSVKVTAGGSAPTVTVKPASGKPNKPAPKPAQ